MLYDFGVRYPIWQNFMMGGKKVVLCYTLLVLNWPYQDLLSTQLVDTLQKGNTLKKKIISSVVLSCSLLCGGEAFAADYASLTISDGSVQSLAAEFCLDDNASVDYCLFVYDDGTQYTRLQTGGLGSSSVEARVYKRSSPNAPSNQASSKLRGTAIGSPSQGDDGIYVHTFDFATLGPGYYDVAFDGVVMPFIFYKQPRDRVDVHFVDTGLVFKDGHELGSDRSAVELSSSDGALALGEPCSVDVTRVNNGQPLGSYVADAVMDEFGDYLDPATCRVTIPLGVVQHGAKTVRLDFSGSTSGFLGSVEATFVK